MSELVTLSSLLYRRRMSSPNARHAVGNQCQSAAGRFLSRLIARGTASSNPLPSSGESANFWFLTGGAPSAAYRKRVAGSASSEGQPDTALVTTPPGERPLELNDRTPCYCAAADSGADASRSQRRADCARIRSKS